MQSYEETTRCLARIPDLPPREGGPLGRYTRFGIGGPADLYVETSNERSFIEGLKTARTSRNDCVVIGDGPNLIVADDGFRGVVLRFTANGIRHMDTCIQAYAGAELQHLVDYSIEHGLRGIETMTGIPGSVGAAVYGNAGAYGHSIMERIYQVRFFDGEAERVFDNAQCEFQYRESVFKRHKDCIIFSTDLHLDVSPAAHLRRAAGDVLKISNPRYPPTMKCAGSIFKNLILAELPGDVQSKVPARVIREGKVPSAYFLEQAGAEGLKNRGI